MKKFTAIAAMTALLIITAACGRNSGQNSGQRPNGSGLKQEKPQPAPEIVIGTTSIDYYDEVYSEGDAFTAIGGILFLACDGFDELLGALADVNQATRSRMEETRESVAGIVADESTKAMRAATYPWRENIFYSCKRCDARILSFTMTDDVLTDKESPEQTVTSWNIDCKNGKVLALDEVTTNYETFWSAVAGKTGATEMVEPEVWYFSGNGLELCFNPGSTVSIGPDYIKPEYLPVPVEVTEAKDRSTETFRKVFFPFAEKVGKINWPEGEALVKEMGVEYTPNVPYESETNGMIRIEDPANGFGINVLFWPGEGFTGEEEDFSKNRVYKVSYFNDDWSIDADNNYLNSPEARWSIIDCTINERYYFKSYEEASKAFVRYCL